MMEKQLRKRIVKFIENTYPDAFIFSTTGCNMVGNPDLCCCINGRYVAIEVKQPGKHPREVQSLRIAQINRAGGIAFWTADLAEVQRVLRRWCLS
jgi:hypothetical protein